MYMFIRIFDLLITVINTLNINKSSAFMAFS